MLAKWLRIFAWIILFLNRKPFGVFQIDISGIFYTVKIGSLMRFNGITIADYFVVTYNQCCKKLRLENNS